MRDVQSGVSYFAHAGQALDVPRVLEDERAEREALRRKGWLVEHE
jgi:hypothetical protein